MIKGGTKAKFLIKNIWGLKNKRLCGTAYIHQNKVVLFLGYDLF